MYKWYNLLVIFLLLLSCKDITPPDIKYSVPRLPQGCVIDAIAYEDAYIANQTVIKKHWSKILALVNSKNEHGHAVCIFEYKESLYCYDTNIGSFYLTSYMPFKEQPQILASIWAKHSNKRFSKAYFLE